MTKMVKIMKIGTIKAESIAVVPHSRSRPAKRTVTSEKVSANDAFAAAEKIIRKGTKLDMAALASELGIARATLYRWTGDRERLIKHVLGSYLRDTFSWYDSRLDKENVVGADRIVKMVEGVMLTLTKSRPVSGLLHNEPDVALRILTGSGPLSLQDATTVRLIGMIEQEIANGRYKPKMEPELLVFTLVRLVDSFVYGDIIAGIDVDLVTAGKIIRSLI